MPTSHDQHPVQHLPPNRAHPPLRVRIRRALELLGAPLPTSKRQLAGRLLQQLAIQAAHRALPAKTVRRQGQLREESLEASRIYIRLTEVFWFANDAPALGHAGIRALNLAERAAGQHGPPGGP